jgi:ACS family glucarate transporter-like MFS transporter
MNASSGVPTLTPTLAPRAGRPRHRVVAYAAALAVLTYVDRVCISKAEPAISEEFHLTREQMGYVFAAFTWGYALFEVPGGWLGDRIGARKVLTRIVLWWSFFTAATGWTWNLASLAVTRFLFGAGEAGCFPNLAKALRTWLPEEERVRAQSIVWLSARWGGAFTPLAVAFLLGLMSWRWATTLLGSLGIVWVLLFLRGYRDHPRESPDVIDGERALIEEGRGIERAAGPTPWRRLLTSPTVLLLALQYMCLNYAWFFYVTWLPRYLVESRGVQGTQAAILNTLPLFLGGIGCLVSGFLSSRVIRWTGSVKAGRRLLACAGFGGSAALLTLSFRLADPVWAMIAMGLAGFANDFAMPVSWASCMDVGGRHTGTLSGMMNTMGAVAAGFAPIVTGVILQKTGNDWSLTFAVSAVLYVLGFCCWLFLDPTTPLDGDAAVPEGGIA